MKIAVLCLALSIMASCPAYAGQAEARDVARLNNCIPKKVEVYQQSLGEDAKTVYRVQCTLPKATGDAPGAKPPDAMLISCDSNLCEMLRPVSMNSK